MSTLCVYVCVCFLHVLFVWRLCRIENVFWESLTCHKCFPSRNSKFRASKNRFYCVFPFQNNCKKEGFFRKGYFKAAIRLIVSEHSSSSLSRPANIKLSLSDDIFFKVSSVGRKDFKYKIICKLGRHGHRYLISIYLYCLLILYIACLHNDTLNHILK